MMKFVSCALVCGASALLAPTAFAQTTINTTGGAGKSEIAPFGVSDTSTYGQTFTVGSDDFLNSFSLYLNGAVNNPIQFKSYVYAWDGTKATGPALFSSGLQQFTGGTDQEFAFATGGVQLVSGSKYVAFLSTAGLQGGRPQSTAQMPGVVDSTYAGGNFVYYNTGNNFGVLTTNTWDCTTGCGFGDAFFKASLSAGAVAGVPEPATWAMMLMGFGAVGGALRRRPKVATRVRFA